MNYESMFLLLDLVVIGMGIYGILEWAKMRKAGHVIDSKLILPSGCTAASCRDPEGFYVYIMPRFLTFCILAMLGGIAAAVNDYWKMFGSIGTLLTVLIVLIVIGVYAVMVRTAYSRYFQ